MTRVTRSILPRCSRQRKSSLGISGGLRSRRRRAFACFNRWRPGLDLIDTEAVPKGVTICNVFGHERAIAEYVIMTMLVLTHRLFEAVTAFRAGSWVAS